MDQDQTVEEQGTLGDGSVIPSVIEMTVPAEKVEEDAVKESEKEASFFKLIFSGALPKTFWLIIGNEFCERFCFYGLRAILTLYMVEFLGQSNSTAINVYHMFTVISYFTPILGAIVADAWLGKYKTIISLSIFYAIGTSLMSILAIPSVGHRNLAGVIVCLIIIAIGTGGIKPCVSAFGADQFVGRDKQLAFFFNAFYIAINVGSLLSMIISPLLKSVECLVPSDDPNCEKYSCGCYTLAFAIPAILMILAIIFFIAGTRWYIRNPPQGSILARSMLAVGSAIKNKVKKIKPNRPVSHWLDYADDKFERPMLEDFKQVLSVSLVFLPLCFFWTLYGTNFSHLFRTTGSTWVIQGKLMYGKLGSWNITPDIIQAINPLLVIFLVPAFDTFLYPFLARFNLLVKPLHRMVVGLLLASLSFVIAGIVQVAIVNDLKSMDNSTNGTVTTLAPGLFSPVPKLVRLINDLPCDAQLMTVGQALKASDGYALAVSESILATSTITSKCAPGVIQGSSLPLGSDIILKRNELNQLIYQIDDGTFMSRFTRNFKPRVTFSRGLRLKRPTEYAVTADNRQSSIHILYQIFQYLVLTAAEILFSISGLHFAYAEADTSMKSVMTAIWLMTNSIGNLITLIINSATGDQSGDIWLFFLYAALIIVVDIVFMILVRFYVPREQRIKEKQAYLDDTQEQSLMKTTIAIDENA
ncbi:hypothetical protein ACOME3_004967 [Neoechinorhynchus agilis]